MVQCGAAWRASCMLQIATAAHELLASLPSLINEHQPEGVEHLVVVGVGVVAVPVQDVVPHLQRSTEQVGMRRRGRWADRQGLGRVMGS